MLPEGLEAMLSGPGCFRFVIQPIVAVILGIRDGRRDAAEALPPYGIALLLRRGARADAVVSGLTTLAKPLTVGIVVDWILQLVIFRGVRFGHAIIVGTVLIALPYTVARALSNRLTIHRDRKRTLPLS